MRNTNWLCESQRFEDLVIHSIPYFPSFRGYRTTVHPGRNVAGRGSSSFYGQESGPSRGSEGRVVVHINLPGSSAGTGMASAGRHHQHSEFGRNVRRSTRCFPASYRRWDNYSSESASDGRILFVCCQLRVCGHFCLQQCSCRPMSESVSFQWENLCFILMRESMFHSNEGINVSFQWGTLCFHSNELMKDPMFHL